MINILICIDDTDNLASKGTGHLADNLRLKLEKKFGIKTSKITRHQLLVNEKIPYTSHNSTMCFRAQVQENNFNNITEFSAVFLKENCAEGSDPGLCIAVEDRITDKSAIINFGKQATCSVLSKNEAYELAEKLGIHLSEHGGTGDGIIGALAGVGLRLTGNHGRFRGGLPLEDNDRLISAGELCKKYNVDDVREFDRGKIPDDAIISLEGKVKTVLIDGLCVLPVIKADKSNDFQWRNLAKDKIKEKYP